MDWTIFQEYGLVGIMVGFMLYSLKRYQDDQKVMRDEHREERGEWREADQQRHEETTKTMIGVTSALDRLAERHRDGDR